MPALAASGRRYLSVAEAFGHGLEAHRLPRVGIPGTHVGHDRGWYGGNLPPARITGSVRIEQVTRGGSGPGEQLATAQLGLAPPAPPLGNARACILRPGRPALSQQLLMRISPHGTLDQFDPPPPLGECIDQAHLGYIVTRSTIRGGEQDTCKSGHGRPLPEAIATGAVALGPALAVIAIEMLVGDMPIGGRCPIVVEATQLLCNGLLLLLTRRRDPGVSSDCHGNPPDEAMAQDACLRSVPSPIAEGTGMPNPTVVHRHSVRGLSGVQASLWA